MNQLDIIALQHNYTIEELFQFGLSELALKSIKKITWEDIIKYNKKISLKMFFHKINIDYMGFCNEENEFSGVIYNNSKMPTQRINRLLLVDYYLLAEFVEIIDSSHFHFFRKFLTSSFLKQSKIINYKKLVESFEKNKMVKKEFKEEFRNDLLQETSLNKQQDNNYIFNNILVK